MTSWADRSYWLRVDDIAYKVYRQLINQFEVRGLTISSFSFANDLSFNFKDFDSQICVDIVHKLVSDKSIKEPDNIAACYADNDYSEIEIKTILPKYSRIKTIKKSKSFQWDFINVIRHELEHVIQGCNIDIDLPKLVDYPRSDNNFLLEACEVPAYVHGFRISTSSRAHFLETITKFINTHGKYLNLCHNEINNTVNIWFNYLKNLKHFSSIKSI